MGVRVTVKLVSIPRQAKDRINTIKWLIKVETRLIRVIIDGVGVGVIVVYGPALSDSNFLRIVIWDIYSVLVFVPNDDSVFLYRYYLVRIRF